MQVNMLEAKSQLSRLVKAALEGQEVVIANHGTPVVRIVRLAGEPKPRGFGQWKADIDLSKDWDSPETNATVARSLLDSPLFPTPHPRAYGKPMAGTGTKSRPTAKAKAGR